MLAISTDSIYAHKVFAEASPSARKVRYPLLSDRTQSISRVYGVLNPDTGAAWRATVIVDPEGRAQTYIIYPAQVGRSALEIVRILEGLQFHRSTGLGVPANWQPGQPGLEREFRLAGTM